MRTVFLLAAAAALAACNPSAPAGGAFPDMNGASYRAEITATDEDGETMPIVMIRSGNKLRMEFHSDEGEMAVVNNGDNGESFVLMTRDGRTMAMQANAAAGYENPAEAWDTDFGAAATRTGACSVAGENGDEWTNTDENGETSTACVTSDGIILRGTENGRLAWETTDVQRGPQSADLFVIPAGVEVMDVGAMLGQAAAQAQGAPAAGGDVCATLRSIGAPAETLAQAGC